MHVTDVTVRGVGSWGWSVPRGSGARTSYKRRASRRQPRGFHPHAATNSAFQLLPATREWHVYRGQPSRCLRIQHFNYSQLNENGTSTGANRRAARSRGKRVNAERYGTAQRMTRHDVLSIWNEAEAVIALRVAADRS